jgi:DNA repair exonuclease SbcCD ATPase subunit
MSDTLGFRITADGCSWACPDCGKEFPTGDSLHLCEAKLPEEYRKLREQIATLTRERDEALAALEEAQETTDTIRLNPDDA